MIGKVHGGGGMTGIPSNIGTIKAYYEEKEVTLAKGANNINLDPSFKPKSILGVLVRIGGYIGGQPMMNWEGNYEADYGISLEFNENSDGTKGIRIIVSSSYSARQLRVLIFYQ